MNKNLTDIFGKAGVIACLFLFPAIVAGQDLSFTPAEKQAYDLVLDMKFEEAKSTLNQRSATSDYVASLAEAIELLVSEDGDKFRPYEENYERRLDSHNSSSALDQFLRAEMLLQWAFVYLKFGHEFDAAINFRSAHHLAEQCSKRNASFLPIRKTSGLLNVLIGSVPEKYTWILGLAGMEGSVNRGLDELGILKESTSPLALEASLTYSLINSFILQRPDTAMAEIKKLLKSRSNRIVKFAGASLAIKNSESELALNLLCSMGEDSTDLAFAGYLKGEVYLQKADYPRAIAAFKSFLKNYRGENYVKDAWYKTGVSYWLDGDRGGADSAFRNSRVTGREFTEADKYAAHALEDDDYPHVKLSKVRYFTDGGYYEDAETALASISPSDLSDERAKAEYLYRRARLHHKLLRMKEAIEDYQKLVALAGDNPWYFAPNACLQLGYIARDENDVEKAKLYFRKAMQYKKHEYKNSIDSKAKTALTQLPRR